MLQRKSKLFLMKIFSLFSVLRGYNIPIIVLAQYLSSIFILDKERRALDILTDWRLFIIVFVSTLAISSGYIFSNSVSIHSVLARFFVFCCLYIFYLVLLAQVKTVPNYWKCHSFVLGYFAIFWNSIVF